MAKIDDVQLLKMLKEGKSGEECAAYFGVGNSTISRHKKKLEKEIAGSFAMMRTDALVKAAVEIRDVEDLGVLVAQARRTMDVVELALHGTEKESYAAQMRLRRLSGQKNFVSLYTTMKAITECDPETAQKIVKRLVEIQAIHSSLDLEVVQ